MGIEILTPVGRIVGGHPMTQHEVMDQVTNQPRLMANGNKLMQSYVGLAIAKGQETHWNQTEWGQKIYQQAVTDWPNGEHGSPTFAWKITDGDSQIPNKKLGMIYSLIEIFFVKNIHHMDFSLYE